MSSYIILTALCTIPNVAGYMLSGEKDEEQVVCVGKEFRLPVYSTLRTVTFTPNSPPGPRRLLLDKVMVKDQRFQWTKDRELVLKEVTHSDQGLYAIKLHDMTDELIRLTVSECIKSYKRSYGQSFELKIPVNTSVLEFSVEDLKPVVLWSWTETNTTDAGRGRLIRNGKMWQAERVTQADGGTYTFRDDAGVILSRSTLTVHALTVNVTRHPMESLNLPLLLPVPHTHLIFTPTREPYDSSLGPGGSVRLIEEGRITEHYYRHRSLISVGRNGSKMEVVIRRLTSRHDGVYDIRDNDGNLVSSTVLQVVERIPRWRAVLKSITVPSGMFVSLAGFMLFVKRYPACSISKIIAGLRTNRTPPAQPPSINIHDYRQPSAEPSHVNVYTQQPGTPRKFSPRASPAHTGYIPVRSRAGSQQSPVPMRTENQDAHRLLAGSSSPQTSATEYDTFNVKLAGASDCLHSSEGCFQFPIKKDIKGNLNQSKDDFSILPLDLDTMESCSVYTSDKLNL